MPWADLYVSLRGVRNRFLIFYLVMVHLKSLLHSLFGMITVVTSMSAFVVQIPSSDFVNTAIFSNVTTYNLEVEIAGPLQAGLFSDPVINNIQYSVSGSLGVTPSGFPSFGFSLDHIFPSSPPITGADFYPLHASSVTGGTLQFQVNAFADLSDGLQLDELDELTPDVTAEIGAGVIFHFNGREEGTGRYHPMFFQLYSDGTGLVQNSNNFGGVNPSTMEFVDLDFGDEYITTISFDASSITIAVPEPASAMAVGLLVLGVVGLRRKSR